MAIKFLSGVNIDSNTLFVDDANNRVGIGTNSPSRQLELVGADAYIQLTRSSTSTQATLGFNTGATNDWLIRTGDGSTSNLQFYSYGTSSYVMTIARSSGNVGIGTTSPSYKLDVNGATQIQNELILSTNDAAFRLYRTTGINYFDWSSGQDLRFSTVTTIGGTGRSTAVTFLSNGNVGIGTTSPSQKLTVSGSTGDILGITNGTTTGYGYVDNNGFGLFTSSGAGGTGIYYRTANIIDHYVNGSIAMRLNSTGNVGIGTTSPATRLDLGSTQGGGIQFLYDSSQVYRNGIYNYWNSGTDTRMDFNIGRTANVAPVTVMSVGYAGNVGIGTTSPSYKTSIVAANGNYWNGTAFTGTPLALSIENSEPGGYDPVLIYNQADSGGTLKNSGAIGMVGTGPWTAGNNASQVSDMYFLVRNSSGSISERLRIKSTGAAQLKAYGSGSFTGTVAYNLAVDSSGNIIETAGGVVDGSGTANYVSKWSDANTLTDSQLFDNGTNVGIGTTSPNAQLDAFTTQGGSTIAATHGTGGTYPKASGISFGATSTSLSVSNNGGTVVFTGGAGIYANNGAASNNPTELVFWTTSAGSPAARLTIASTGAATFTSSVTASSLIKSGGTSSQYLMADGSVSTTSNVAPRYVATVNVSQTAYTQVCTIVGGSLASAVNMSFQGTSGNVVVNVTAQILVNHFQDIVITTTSGFYSQLNIRVISNNNESYSVEAQVISAQGQTTDLNIEVFPLNSESVTFGGSPLTPGTTLVHATRSGVYVSATEPMSISSGSDIYAAGNVGIGTTAPGTLLHLVQSSGPTIRLVRTSNRFDITADNDFMELNARDASTYMIFKTADSERMRITAAGNVGIGTTSPTAKLHVQGTSYFFDQSIFSDKVGIGTTAPNAPLEVQADSGGTSIRVKGRAAANSGTIRFFNNASSTQLAKIESSDNSFEIGSLNNVYAAFLTNGTEQMRITSAGNVGIGTTAPANNLHVYNASGSTIAIDGAGGNNTGLQYKNNGSLEAAITYVPATSQLHIFRGGDVMVIGNSNVGIGTTAPIDKLHIVGGLTSTSIAAPSNTSIGSLQFGYDGTNGLIRSWNSSPIIYQAYNYQSWETSGSERMRITSAGNVGIGTTSPSYKLDVTGAARVTSTLLGGGRISAATEYRLNDNSYSRVAIIDGGGAFAGGYNFNINSGTPQHDSTGAVSAYYYNSAGYISFYTNSSQSAGTAASERMRIDASGKVLVNTTTSHGTLTIEQSVSESGLVVNSSTASAPTLYLRDAGGAGYSELLANNKLSINASNVGIGTTSPGAKLDVSGTGRFSQDTTDYTLVVSNAHASSDQNYISLRAGATQIGAINRPVGTNDIFLFSYYGNLTFGANTGGNATERMRITNAGNVGIGTTAPSYALSVVRNANDWVGQYKNYGSNAYGLQIDLSGSTGATGGYVIGAYSQTGTGFFLKNDGTVGIGTTSPTEKLHVDGSVVVTYNNSYQSTNSTGNKAILARVSPTSGIVNYAEYATVTNLNGFVIGSDDAQVKGVYASDKLEFITNTATRMAITSGGNVGIGTASPTNILHITGVMRMDNVSANDPTLTNNATPKHGYGDVANEIYLAEPAAWFKINVEGTDYIIPAYLESV